MLPHFTSSTHSNSSNSVNITKSDIGIIISSQNLAYASSKFFFGILSDLVSCRILFGSGLFLSGIVNIGLKKEITVYNLYAFSFLIGLAQGPAWPSCAKILQNWLPKNQFGTWWSVLSTAGNLAGTIGPIMMTYVALKYHWSIGFMILGCLCMSVGYLSIILLRNKPSDIGLKNLDEIEESDNEGLADTFMANEDDFEENQIETESESEEESEENKVPYTQQIKLLFSYPFFASICLVYFLVQLIKTIYSDVAQMYLIKVLKVEEYTASYFVSSFELFGLVGTLLSGILSDAIISYKRNLLKTNVNKKVVPIKIRYVIICVYVLTIAGAMHLFNFYVKVGVSRNFLLVIGSVLGALCYGAISLLGVMAMEFTTNELSGTSHAIASLAANIGAVFAGLPFNLMSRYYSWNLTFKLVEYFSLVVLIVILMFRNYANYYSSMNIKVKTQ